MKGQRAFSETLACYEYSGVISFLIKRYKYSRNWYIGSILAELMRKRIASMPSIEVDCMVPMPLSSMRLCMRGFNQTRQITRSLAKDLKIPERLDLLYRRKGLVSQARLGLYQRMSRRRDDFKASPKAAGLRILLVDDVMTTTATMQAAAASLKKAGADQITALVLARAVS